jgi:hypothetical protein
MKRLHLYLLSISLVPVLTIFSCKKYVQQQEQNAALSIMTSGYWYVSGYKQNGSDITASFSGYLFKFDANNTVTGSLGNSSTTGQWSDDITARTITADFPGAGQPLVNLNATWRITDSYSDSVSARYIDTVNKITDYLQLKKQ